MQISEISTIDTAVSWAEYKVCGQKNLNPVSPLSKEEMITAYHEGREKGATHMLIVWDTYDIDDSYNFIVYCNPGEDIHAVIERHSAPGYERVSAVFDLRLDIDEQIQEGHPWHT